MQKTITEQQTNQISLMRELSDIKSSLAVNTTKTENITSDISEIKSDIKDFNSKAITRPEFSDLSKIVTDFKVDHEERMRSVERFKDNWNGRYAIIAVLIMFIIGLAGSYLNHLWF